MLIISCTLGTNRLVFDVTFLRQVAEYHAGVQRPDGTFFDEAEANSPEKRNNSDVDKLCMETLCIYRLDVDKNDATTSSAVETGRGQRRNPRGKDSQQLRELDGAANSRQKIPKGGNDASSSSQLSDLAAVRREMCPVCGSKRQIYCGDCGGVRMADGGAFLPPRILLPFDVLLVMHW